jgi:hypothetical protein
VGKRRGTQLPRFGYPVARRVHTGFATDATTMISMTRPRGHGDAHAMNALQAFGVAPLPTPNLLPPARSAAEDDSHGR